MKSVQGIFVWSRYMRWYSFNIQDGYVVTNSHVIENCNGVFTLQPLTMLMKLVKLNILQN